MNLTFFIFILHFPIILLFQEITLVDRFMEELVDRNSSEKLGVYHLMPQCLASGVTNKFW